MSESYDLFCRWKHVKGIHSDNAGAIALGVGRATVSLWKKGKNAEIHFVERMASDIGDSPEEWAARVMAERSGSAEESSAWKRIAAKLAASTAMVVVMLGAMPLPARSSDAPQAALQGVHDRHYANYRSGLFCSGVNSLLAEMAVLAYEA